MRDHAICDKEIDRLVGLVKDFVVLTNKFLLVDASGTIEDLVEDAEQLLAEASTVGADRFAGRSA